MNKALLDIRSCVQEEFVMVKKFKNYKYYVPFHAFIAFSTSHIDFSLFFIHGTYFHHSKYEGTCIY